MNALLCGVLGVVDVMYVLSVVNCFVHSPDIYYIFCVFRLTEGDASRDSAGRPA